MQNSLDGIFESNAKEVRARLEETKDRKYNKKVEMIELYLNRVLHW